MFHREEINILYKDNPNLGRKVVTTSSGQKEYRFNCKKIKDEYHAKNVDCFFLEKEQQWYRVKSGLIEFDYEKGRWILTTNAKQTCMKGVVGFNENKSSVIGYFSPNPFTNCHVELDKKPMIKVERTVEQGFLNSSHSHSQPIEVPSSPKSESKVTTLVAISSEMLLENGFVEDFSTGIWYRRENCSLEDIERLQRPRNEVDHTTKGYNLEDNAAEMNDKIKYYNQYQPKLSKDVRRYGKMLGDVSFGLEIECEKGFLPEYIQNRTGVVICRDGSLNGANGKPGPEFVTIPLSGAKGLQTIVDLSKELSKRTTIDIKCSLHIHIGNLPTTRVYLISLFRLCSKIQNELFTMFPFYKTNPDGVKRQNYCQKLPTLSMYAADPYFSKIEFDEYVNGNYKKLFSWLAEGYNPNKDHNRKNGIHPVQYKWSRHKRYYWMNIMNTIFSGRNTVEFRLHTPTTNAQKMINWLFICTAIVKYANSHSREILLSKNGITLNQIMNHYRQYGSRGEFLSDYLMAYINERKQKFTDDYNKGDRLSKWEMEEDKQYVFQYENVNHLF